MDVAESGIVSQPVWQENGIWGVVDGKNGKVDRSRSLRGWKAMLKEGNRLQPKGSWQSWKLLGRTVT